LNAECGRLKPPDEEWLRGDLGPCTLHSERSEMENADKKSNFLIQHLRLVAKHKFLIIIPLVAVFLGSTIVGSTQRKTYSATAVFRMMSRGAAKGKQVGRITAEDLKNDLDVMKQVIFSRANLVEIMRHVGLDSSYRHLPEFAREGREEELVTQLRKNLDVEQKAPQVYAVSYGTDDPEMAARVANAIMTRYIEGVLKEEREDMAATVAFLEKKVKEYQAEVRACSDELERFKAAHILELPGSDLSMSAELRKLRDELAAAEAELTSAETAKKEIEKQLLSVDPSAIKKTVKQMSPSISQFKMQVAQLESELAALQTRFTPLHPEVVKKNAEVERVKLLIDKAEEEVITEQTSEANPLHVSLQQELKNAEVRIAAAKRRKEDLIAKKADCEKRVQNAPALQNELDTLTEKEASARKLLEHYATEQENARIEQEKAIDQKGTRFQVLDYARKSSASAKSNSLKMALLGLLVGGGLGLGLAVVRDHMDTSFKDVGDAASFLSVPIIGTIPVISTAAEKARENKKETLGWIVVGVLVILLGGALVVITLTPFPGR